MKGRRLFNGCGREDRKTEGCIRIDCDWKTIQLAAITAPYIAVKVQYPFIFSMSSLIEMTRYMFIKDDIYSMENLILGYVL